MFVSLCTGMELLIKDKSSKHSIWLNYGHCHAFLSAKIMAMVWVRVHNGQVQIQISILGVNIFRVYGLMVWMFLPYEKLQDLHETGVHLEKVP